MTGAATERGSKVARRLKQSKSGDFKGQGDRNTGLGRAECWGSGPLALAYQGVDNAIVN